MNLTSFYFLGSDQLLLRQWTFPISIAPSRCWTRFFCHLTSIVFYYLQSCGNLNCVVLNNQLSFIIRKWPENDICAGKPSVLIGINACISFNICKTSINAGILRRLDLIISFRRVWSCIVHKRKLHLIDELFTSCCDTNPFGMWTPGECQLSKLINPVGKCCGPEVKTKLDLAYKFVFKFRSFRCGNDYTLHGGDSRLICRVRIVHTRSTTSFTGACTLKRGVA